MKKLICLCLAACFLFILVACGEKSAIQKATGASAEESRIIEQAITNAGIQYETIKKADDSTDVDGAQSTQTLQLTNYIVTDRDGNAFLLVLDEDYSVIVITDMDGNSL